jgi:hypothetical protein
VIVARGTYSATVIQGGVDGSQNDGEQARELGRRLGQPAVGAISPAPARARDRAQRRLAGAVGPDEREPLPRLHRRVGRPRRAPASDRHVTQLITQILPGRPQDEREERAPISADHAGGISAGRRGARDHVRGTRKPAPMTSEAEQAR